MLKGKRKSPAHSGGPKERKGQRAFDLQKRRRGICAVPSYIMCLPAENFSDLRTPHRLSAFRDERSRFSIRVVRRIRPEAGFLNILHLIEFFSRQRKNKEKNKEQAIIQAENTKERRARASDPC